ncbi:MAG: phosphoribosylglycinamide formyltransferase 2, partial [Pseudomonadota bacterium]|nr:phosphoribosylglycinamide formyltransferase 2 [Pseudomonadota bacterium]
VIIAEGNSSSVIFGNLEGALTEPDTQLRLFGKPEVRGERRMGVGLALGADLKEARSKAFAVAQAVTVELG